MSAPKPKSGIRYPDEATAEQRSALDSDESSLGPTWVPRWKDLLYSPLAGLAEACIKAKEQERFAEDKRRTKKSK